MIFCAEEKCRLCLLIAGSANCLRKQARKYLAMSKNALNRGVRHTLHDLGTQLMDEASAIDQG